MCPSRPKAGRKHARGQTGATLVRYAQRSCSEAGGRFFTPKMEERKAMVIETGCSIFHIKWQAGFGLEAVGSVESGKIVPFSTCGFSARRRRSVPPHTRQPARWLPFWPLGVPFRAWNEMCSFQYLRPTGCALPLQCHRQQPKGLFYLSRLLFCPDIKRHVRTTQKNPRHQTGARHAAL